MIDYLDHGGQDSANSGPISHHDERQRREMPKKERRGYTSHHDSSSSCSFSTERGRLKSNHYPSFRRILRVWGLCSAFRLLNTCLIHSYFDPDEFWQTLEPSYCLVFWDTRNTHTQDYDSSNCPGFTWEWKRRDVAVSPLLVSPSSNVSNYGILDSVRHIVQHDGGPIRSHLSILPTVLLYFILRTFRLDTPWLVARGPMLCNAVCVAATVDVAVWVTARNLYATHWNHHHHHHPYPHHDHDHDHDATTAAWWCLGTSLFSWFNAYALIRTYSNSQETALLMVSLALVAPELCGDINSTSTHSRKGSIEQANTTPILTPAPIPTPDPAHRNYGTMFRTGLAFYFGGLSTALRFTSLAAFVPLGVLLARPPPPYHSHRDGRRRRRRIFGWCVYVFGMGRFLLLVPCAVCGLAGLATACLLDSFLFGFATIPSLNALYVNGMLNVARLYGTHPWYWYWTTGMPCVSGVLLFPLLLVVHPGVMMRMMMRRIVSCRRRANGDANHDRSFEMEGGCDEIDYASVGERSIGCIILIYLSVLSISPHKEFRFIQPVLPLVCLLTGPRLRQIVIHCSPLVPVSEHAANMASWKSRTLLLALCVINLLPVLFLGLFHQTGPILVNREILRQESTGSAYYSESRDDADAAAADDDDAAFQTLMNATFCTTPHRRAPVVWYLTGECHSTPLHSSLHMQYRRRSSATTIANSDTPPLSSSSSLHFDTWSLDCSPSCRAQPEIVGECETTQFNHNPVRFLHNALGKSATATVSQELHSISEAHTTRRRSIPDFVVTTTSFQALMEPILHHELGFQLTGRFPHHISGMTLRAGVTSRTSITFGSGHEESAEADIQRRRISVLNSWVEIHMEDFLLYSRSPR